MRPASADTGTMQADTSPLKAAKCVTPRLRRQPLVPLCSHGYGDRLVGELL